MISIMFTKEELDFLAQIIENAPLQGTVKSLPAALSMMVAILNKINEANKIMQNPEHGTLPHE